MIYYRCPFCGRECGTRDQIRDHVRWDHEERIDDGVVIVEVNYDHDRTPVKIPVDIVLPEDISSEKDGMDRYWDVVDKRLKELCNCADCVARRKLRLAAEQAEEFADD